MKIIFAGIRHELIRGRGACQARPVVVSSRQWLGRFVASNYGARRWAARNVSRVSLGASVDVALRRARKCDAATRRSPSDKLA